MIIFFLNASPAFKIDVISRLCIIGPGSYLICLRSFKCDKVFQLIVADLNVDSLFRELYCAIGSFVKRLRHNRVFLRIYHKIEPFL